MNDIAIAAAKPTAKRLILSLLSAPSLEVVRVGFLVRWGALFEIDAAAIRVALGRLARQGLIETVERGVYTIGPAGALMARTARQWMSVEQGIRPWSGSWIFVPTANLGRSDRTALRARERALRLQGFAELHAGFWLRPDNLEQSLEATRDALVSLGLESAALVCRVTDIQGLDDDALGGLWSRAGLEEGYRTHLAAMEASARRLPELTPAEAARETFSVGESVIRLINADPLLPEQMVDAAARKQVIAKMVEYNALGEAAWKAFDLESASQANGARD